MLSHKRYKELKARRKQLHIQMRLYVKYQFRFRDKIKEQTPGYNRTTQYFRLINEINLINDTLKLHKILWKQHLVTNA